MKFLARIDEFHHQASAAMGGLDDFGPPDYREGMERLLSDLDRYPVYTEAGAEGLAQQIIGLLMGRLSLFSGLKQHPDAASSTIKKPIVIVGMARTGTTALHRILCQDPNRQWLPFWLASFPMVRPPRETWETNPVFQQVRQALTGNPFYTEEMQAIHPIVAELADECRWALDQTFWNSSIILAIKTRAYVQWFHQADTRPFYAYHKKVLGLIGHKDDRQWILKDPGHMSGIEGLLAAYPDACIVQTHRDPQESMTSIANLSWLVRSSREPILDSREVGTDNLNFWAPGLQRIERVRRESDPARFFDVHINEIRKDPVDVIERIFKHFDLPITDEARASWQQQPKSEDNFGHSAKVVPPDLGYTRERVYDAIGDYYERYLSVCDEKGFNP